MIQLGRQELQSVEFSPLKRTVIYERHLASKGQVAVLLGTCQHCFNGAAARQIVKFLSQLDNWIARHTYLKCHLMLCRYV